MPPNRPQSNYSKRPARRLRLPKIGPLKTKGLLEEYFYVFLAVTTAAVAILGKAGGLDAYDAVVVGLWVGGFMWFAWQLKSYFKEKSKTEQQKKSTQPVKAPSQLAKGPVPTSMKPMIGPQWPPKPAQRPSQGGQNSDAQGKKKGFIYERPTLPDRKPKFPANWPGRQDKKPER
jgi:hypothetical protein